MSLVRSFLFAVSVAMLPFTLSGCGESEPVPITDEVAEEIEQHDQEVLDEESEL